MRNPLWGLMVAGCVALSVTGCASLKTAGKAAGRNPVAGLASKADKPGQNERELRLSMGRIKEREGQLQKAREIYESLLQEQSEDATAHHRLGVVLTRLGDMDGGLEHLRQADSLQPDHAPILNDLGYACMMSNRFDVAQQIFLTAIEQDPGDQRALNNLALAYGYNGDMENCFATFRRTMPEAEALSNLGYVAMQIGRRDMATSCFSRALAIDPEQKRAAEALVQVADLDRQLQQRKDLAAATKELQQPEQDVIQAGATAPRK